MPITRLLQALQIINHCSRERAVKIPPLLLVEWHDVVKSEQAKLSGADFLVIVARQRQWEFGNQRQQRAKSIRAETVGIDRRSHSQAEINTMFPFRQSISQQCLAPEQMRLRLEFTIAKTVTPAVGAETAFVPRGKFHRQSRKQNRLAASPAQTRTHTEGSMVRREVEV